MGNAIQFGIYRLSFIIILFLLGAQLKAQDFYVDTAGLKHEVKLTRWFINQCFVNENNQVKPLFINELQEVYRKQSEVSYVPYASYVNQLDYLNFLIPSVESLRALKTDYFRDEHYDVWITGDYLVYHLRNSKYAGVSDFSNLSKSDLYESKYNDSTLFERKGQGGIPKVNNGVVYLYHDDVGFNKVVSSDIEDDYFRLQMSRYTFDSNLNDSIFSDDFKLKSKKFLNFFDKEISPLTSIQYNDEDLADYYISSLRNGGALVVLLNLDKKKIDLYRNAGNVKLANELEEKLLFDNRMYAISFLDSSVFDFCEVYVTDAKNRGMILNGTKEAIFLNQNLELDSSIRLAEHFVLFVRKGQVFETQLANSYNLHKKMVTSNPVVQEALVVYDASNIQLIHPFPNFVRTTTASFSSKYKIKKSKMVKEFLDAESSVNEPEMEFTDMAIKLQTQYKLEDIDRNKLGVAYSMNANFYGYYFQAMKRNVHTSFNYTWENKSNYANTFWFPAPAITTGRF